VFQASRFAPRRLGKMLQVALRTIGDRSHHAFGDIRLLPRGEEARISIARRASPPECNGGRGKWCDSFSLHFVKLVGAVGVQDWLVDQAEFEALEDNFGSDSSCGQDGDADHDEAAHRRHARIWFDESHALRPLLPHDARRHLPAHPFATID
jgi:hypothetical protein